MAQGFPVMPSFIEQSALWDWWTHMGYIQRNQFVGLIWLASSSCFAFAATGYNGRRNGSFVLRWAYWLFVCSGHLLLCAMLDGGRSWTLAGGLIAFMIAYATLCEFAAWKQLLRRKREQPVCSQSVPHVELKPHRATLARPRNQPR